MSEDPSTLNGNCHCGRFRFELTGADLTQVIKCDCDHCRKAGCLWLGLSSPKIRFHPTRNGDHLIHYTSERFKKQFCSVCGTTITGEHADEALPGWAVNIRSIRQLNPFDYDHRGLTAGRKSEVPSPLSGSCHCGKIEVQLLQPLAELDVREDNCSICTRNAWIGVYPSKSQVALSGTEHTQDYRFERQFNGFPFCRTCGIHVYQNLYGPPQHIVDALPEQRKEAVRKMLDVQPINVRVLQGIEVTDLGVKRSDEGTAGYESTVLGIKEVTKT